MSEWRVFKVGEVAGIFDGPHATPKKTEAGPWFLSISSLKQGQLDLSESAHLSDEDFAKWTRRITPSEGDILFSYETRLGEAAMMPGGIQACLGRRMGLLRPKLDKIDSRFLLYAYLGPGFQQVIRERSIHGATVDRIPLVDLPDWPIAVPPLPDQRVIGELLGTIDDKIASNGTMAEVGEKLAFAIASDVRWTEIAPLRNIVSQVRKQVAPESVASDVVAHYSLPSFDAGQLPEIVPPAVIKSAKFLVSEPAVLLSKLNPVTPRVWSVEPDQCLPALASTEFMVLKPVDGVTPDEIWAVTKQPIFTSDLVGLATGTSNSHQRVRPDDVLATHVVDPRSLPVVDRAVITSVAKRCRKARSESRALAELRDVLLPKLMSGEIRVRDAEKAVEDAV